MDFANINVPKKKEGWHGPFRNAGPGILFSAEKQDNRLSLPAGKPEDLGKGLS
jgi:hypothetical protein